MDDPNQLALFTIDVDGAVICGRCSLPPPTKWCWDDPASCPLGMPRRAKHQWIPRW